MGKVNHWSTMWAGGSLYFDFIYVGIDLSNTTIDTVVPALQGKIALEYK